MFDLQLRIGPVAITAHFILESLAYFVGFALYRRLRREGDIVSTPERSSVVVAAILGASVDTRVLPSIVHAMIAYGAIACNVAALRIEISALTESSRIVDEVNRLLSP